MPARKVYKHKKVYVQRPIGRGGKLFRFIYRQRRVLYLGGLYKDDPSYVGPYSWQGADTQYQTTPLPIVANPATLCQLIFETQYTPYDGKMPSFGPLANTTLKEAKFPEIFFYRYIMPIHYGIGTRVIRCRTVIDSQASAGWTPSPNDLQSADLSWQLPIHCYWRADYSNMNSIYPFYKGNSPDPTTGGFYSMFNTMLYTPSGGYTSEAGYDPTDATILATMSNQHEMLVNKRYAKCTIQPGKDCIMQLQANFNTSGLGGQFTDIQDATIFTPALITAPVSCWIRNFLSKTGAPGQANMGGYAGIPGDLYMAYVQPELNPDYAALFATQLTDAKPKARLCVELETTTTLILNASERMPDQFIWGKTLIPG